jgi:hypothetical protein
MSKGLPPCPHGAFSHFSFCILYFEIAPRCQALPGSAL